VYIKVPQNAPKAIYETAKFSGVPFSGTSEVHKRQSKISGKAATFPGAQACTRSDKIFLEQHVIRRYLRMHQKQIL